MDQKQNWLERPIHPALPKITNEIAIFAIIILIAIFTRFYNLGARVMSHDESLHTYFSWLLYRGQGYQHNPMMHGPFQFHIVALTYFLFGVSDFTSRIPAALFSIGTVWMVWYWRRYLGKWGALIAGLLLVISPYMLFYGRYVRNESFVGFSGIVMLYAILRHLEVGGKKYLYLMAAALVLHFASKETSFIYAAQALIFLAIYFIAQVTRSNWDSDKDFRGFIIALAVAILFAAGTATYGMYTHKTAVPSGAVTAQPADPSATASPLAPPATGTVSPVTILAVIAFVALIIASYFLIRGYTWERIRNERSFELLIICGTLVLPMLTAFPIKFLEKWLKVTIPTTASEVQAMGADLRGIFIIAGFLIAMFAISAAIGLLWNKDKWWKTALVFWAPFTVFYTTVFTNSDGFFTGTIGSLGYWLAQQGVERGSQPWYYYVLVQIPMYEFLPALGLFLAIIIGLSRRPAPRIEENEEEEVLALLDESKSEENNFSNMFSLLVWWSFITVIAFSVAGERMPWLTYHMAWPMILITGWGLGRIIDGTDWNGLKERKPLLSLAVIAVFIVSLMGMLLALSGATPPFQGRELPQLQATSAFLLPTIVAIISAVGATCLLRDWSFSQIVRVLTLLFFSLLAVLTGRAAFRASYITYDQATEFLVYAHGATGIKDVIAQAKEISERTTGGMGVALAYDASAPDTGVSWPFVWYLRDFTNQRSFDQPTRSLRDSVVIIVDEKNFDKIEPAIGDGYYRLDYIRMWWPMQDYFNLVYDRDATQPFPEDYECKGWFSIFKLRKSKDYSHFCEGFTDPAIRAGIIDIWLNRDYTKYAAAKGRPDLTLTTWQPADRMRLYIRKDVAAQIWNYGVAPTVVESAPDPLEGKYVLISADTILDNTQSNPVLMNAPRSLAFAKDGTMYVADSRDHRILHLNTDGTVIGQWGTFADGVNIPIGEGTFNEPWGVAVGPDGSVYVTDTWNHRIEKFTPEGGFIKAWGYFGQGEAPEAFYGPRGLAVDAKGRVYVADTGNKRVVVFDADGNFVTQFGSAGFQPGQFDEPVGITIDKNGTVYVADTWNQRIQTFVPVELENGLAFIPDKQWDVPGWSGQSIDNKPFIAVSDDLHVFVTDPDAYRVIEYSPTGSVVRVWGDFGNTPSTFGLASGVAVDPEGHIWVTDGLYNRVLRFTLP